MKKSASALALISLFLYAFTANANIVANQKIPQPNINLGMLDPFNDDPFFQSQNNLMNQMQTMQKAMDELLKTQFYKINNLASQYHQQPFGSDANIEIKENNSELIYKIKLPKDTDNKVDVSVKNNHLVLSVNATQKITHTQNHSKSVTYSQSNYSQSFELPSGYDSKSMQTNIKDSNLIVKFKKIDQKHSIKKSRNVL